MNAEKKYTWYKVASNIDEIAFGSNDLAEVHVNNKIVCIAKNKDTLHACAHKCPHAGGSMQNGFIDAVGNIVCPLHRYKFSLQNGRNVSGEGYFLKTYPIKKEETGIYIGFEEKKGFFNF